MADIIRNRGLPDKKRLFMQHFQILEKLQAHELFICPRRHPEVIKSIQSSPCASKM